MLKLKRIYEPVSQQDGYRILVDRLWPRGVSKAKAQVDLWLKEVAPSDELREWFGHDPEKWDAFRKRYWHELEDNSEAVQKLREHIREGHNTTLVYGAKDEEHNQAVALKEFLEK